VNNQRWLFGRSTYRPAGETIDTRRYEVAPILGDGPAKSFVLAHHYSASYPAARFRFGLYTIGGTLDGYHLPIDRAGLGASRRGNRTGEGVAAESAADLVSLGNDGPSVEPRKRKGVSGHGSPVCKVGASPAREAPDRHLVGVAIFSVPMRKEVITSPLKCAFAEGTELGRLVLLDAVPGNGESWFVARCFDLLKRQGIAGVVSHSDPVPRQTADGEIVLPGHVGFVYQALSAVYLGRTKARALKLLPDGRVLSDRAEAKIRAGDSRWRSAARPLIEAGAAEPADDSPHALRAWANLWIPRLTRRMPHAGNHRYAWALDRRLRKLLPTAQPYPKLIDGRRAA
jgi:hypothetical protein